MGLFLVAQGAQADLGQTLVLFKGDPRMTGIAVFGATPADHEARILYPVMAMTRKTAEFLSQLKSREKIQCEFEAFKQDLGKGTRNVVWSLYAVDARSCVPYGR
jgi:hypothetical protein